ncbi:replication protein P [Pantoea agglomerans]|uniref:replication protein P n=1 Tax=Enterobacter agglomerans TaxID=549 RepID=UPI003AFB5A3A
MATLFSNLKLTFLTTFSSTLKTQRIKQQRSGNRLPRSLKMASLPNSSYQRARASCPPLWPSSGRFISWCREGDTSAAGLPDENTLYDMVIRYSAERGL